MVYPQAARKTLGLMAVSGLMGFGIVTFLTEDLSPTANVVATPANNLAGTGWLTFMIGLFIGALMVGTYFYFAKVERNRFE